MREQRLVRVDPRTGETVTFEWIAQDATTLGQRARELSMICDGCGWRTTLSYDNPPPGWISTERGDLCPACAV